MATTHRDDAGSAAYRMQIELAPKLRGQFPWLKVDALQAVVEETASTLQKQLLAQEQAINEAKSRTDFFSLSGELRNQVYEEALTKEENVLVDLLGSFPERPSLPALLQTNRAVRAEALSIYHASNVFVFTWNPFKGLSHHIASPLRKWLQLIGTKSASQIKELRLMCTREPPKTVTFSRSGMYNRPTTIPFEIKRDVHKALDLERFGVKEGQFKIYYKSIPVFRGQSPRGEIL